MPENTQSYFGDVLAKLSETGREQEVAVDQAFKAKLKEELMAQNVPDAPAVPPETGARADLRVVFRRWQALIIGLPALFFTVLILFVLRALFFSEAGPETIFEKKYNVSFAGPFSAEERTAVFKPILVKLVSKRNSEAVRVVRKNRDRVLVQVYIENNGREEFEIVEENGKWFGKAYEFFEKDV